MAQAREHVSLVRGTTHVMLTTPVSGSRTLTEVRLLEALVRLGAVHKRLTDWKLSLGPRLRCDAVA